jgi:hypothetical protein
MAIVRAAWLVTANVALAIMFAVFSYLQLNDTNPEIYDHPSLLDAWSWTAFYGLVAVLCLLSIFRRVPSLLLGVAAVFCLCEMARTAPGLYDNLFHAGRFTMAGTSMSASHPEVELTREFFGALIALGAVGFLGWQATRAERSRA